MGETSKQDDKENFRGLEGSLNKQADEQAEREADEQAERDASEWIKSGVAWGRGTEKWEIEEDDQDAVDQIEKDLTERPLSKLSLAELKTLKTIIQYRIRTLKLGQAIIGQLDDSIAGRILKEANIGEKFAKAVDIEGKRVRDYPTDLKIIEGLIGQREK